MDKILDFFKEFELENIMPPLEGFLNDLEGWVRLAVLAAPLVLLVLGLWYFFLPPKEANHSVGFRTYWTMGSVEAWRYAQKLSGMFYMVLGGVLLIVMAVISIGFDGMEAGKMMNTALVCVIVEAVLALAAWVTVNVLVIKAYDKEGNRRK